MSEPTDLFNDPLNPFGIGRSAEAEIGREAVPIDFVDLDMLGLVWNGTWFALPETAAPPDHAAFLAASRAAFDADLTGCEWDDLLGALQVANDGAPAELPPGGPQTPLRSREASGGTLEAANAPPASTGPPTILDSALAMAARGLAVLPVRAGGKVPLAPDWPDTATTDEAMIRRLFKAGPDSINFGIAGRGLLILDLDRKEGHDGVAELAKLEVPHGALPPTFAIRTPSGGRHLYFRSPAPVANSAGKLAPGVDVRGERGQCLGPGSIVDGKRYAIEQDAPIAEAPHWLFSMAGDPKPRERSADRTPAASLDQEEDLAWARRYLATEAPAAVLGKGNATVYAVACRLVVRGIAEDTAIALMWELYNPRCAPPWGANEADSFEAPIRSAFQRSQNRPASESTEMLKNEAGEPVTLPLPASEAATAPAKRFRATVFDPAAPIDPPEHYLYGLHHVKGILTVTAAPGGYGKSQLGLAEAMCMAAGRELLGERVYEPLRVWFLSLDDPLRITRKRAVAFMRLHGLSASDFGNGRLMLDGSDTLPPSLVKVATGGREGVKVDDATVSAFIAELKERQVDVLILDPLVKFHAVEENDNPAMNIVGETLAGIAARAGCAVETIVHTSKPKGQQITAEHVRGASSFVNAARAVRVVNPMTEDEARRLGIAEEKRLRLFRVDLSKGNLAPPSDARWFQRMPVALDNGNDRMPEGESFPAVTRYRLPDPIATTTDLDIAKALEKLAAGPDGAGSPWRASDKASGYIGVGIAEALGLDTGDPQTRATCRRLIKDWLARGLLIERRTRVKSEGRDTPFIHIPADWRERLAALAVSARACAVTADEAGPGIEDPNRRT